MLTYSDSVESGSTEHMACDCRETRNKNTPALEEKRLNGKQCGNHLPGEYSTVEDKMEDVQLECCQVKITDDLYLC